MNSVHKTTLSFLIFAVGVLQTTGWAGERTPGPLSRAVQERQRQEQAKSAPQQLYGTWVAEDVETDQGEVKIKLIFREEGPVRVLAWSDLFFVGQVRNLKAPYQVKGNTISSRAIRGGTQVQFWFDEGYLVIEYEDGKQVRFQRVSGERDRAVRG